MGRPSTATNGNRAQPAANTTRTRFAALLAEHLRNGMRPAAAAGEPWTYAEFAGEVTSSRGNDFVSPRSVANWCNGRSLPAEIEPILRALFGPGDRHAEAREALRNAFLAAKHAATIRGAEPDPAGTVWVARNDQFVPDRSIRPTDQRAAADPLRQQMQAAIRTMAAELVDPAARVSNTRTWGRLSATAAAFRAVVDGDPLAMPERLGDAYPLLLRLGRCLETDIRVQRDPAASDGPLDPDIHGLLTDLVRTAAPWLRGFPTVAAWDDAAGKALVRADLFQPARDFTRIAHAQQAISARDADEVDLLAEAADATDYQGQKAGNRAVGDAKNLMLAAAGTVAMFLSGAVASDFATRSLLVQRAAATLAAAEAEVEKFATTLPDDLSHALRSLIKEGQRPGGSAPPVIPALPEPPVPDDVEVMARAMILGGVAPPSVWRPLIRRLEFAGTTLGGLNLLSGLIGLQSLDLRGTQVSDVTPLAGLTALHSLDLGGTRVNDVTPLAGLTALQSLYLGGTPVRDVTPLAGLTALRSLDLAGTWVIDLTRLAGLSALQSLNLGGPPVRDVTPLAGLSVLQSLNLWKARVIDLTPLAGLTALQSLDLSGAPVSDVTPLAGLTALQSLGLGSTPVSDVTPLAGLTALQSLELDDTNVSDVTALAGLTALRSLDVQGTRVSDVTPLAGLTALQRLNLRGTRVSDVTPLAGLTALESLDLRDTQLSDVAPLHHIRGLKFSRDPAPRRSADRPPGRT